MSGKFDNAGADALTKYLRQQVADLAIEPNTKALFLYVLDNASAFVQFARAYGIQKGRGKVKPDQLMLAFLKSKGRSLADFGITVVDSQTMSDAWACVSLVLDLHSSMKYASAGPFGVAVMVGFMINDVSAFLVSFTPAQRAYYELFLKKSSVAAVEVTLADDPSPPVSLARR